MVTATYTVEIAWDGNSVVPFRLDVSEFDSSDVFLGQAPVSYTGTYTDVTDDCGAIRIKRGKADPASPIQPGECTLTLCDLDGEYDPENSSGTYYEKILPGRGVRVKATYSATDYYLFWGFIESAEYDARTYTLTVTAVDFLQSMSETYARSGETYTGETVGYLVEQVALYSGFYDSAKLDVNDVGRTISVGVSLLGESPGIELATELNAVENGAFWVAADGDFVYRSRTELAARTSSGTLPAGSFSRSNPSVSRQTVVNAAVVTVASLPDGSDRVAYADDTDSVLTYGRREVSVSTDYLTTLSEAQALADAIVADGADIVSSLWRIEFPATQDATALVQALARDLYDLATIGSHGTFSIVGIEHEIDVASFHRVAWVIE